MIVSASYSDDIPAYYGRWFMRRLDAGFCRTFDSNGLQFHRVELTRDAVDGFVFWTKDATPFLDALKEIYRRDFAFVVQYSIGTDSDNAVRSMHALEAAYGPRCAVWRYAPAGAATLPQKTQLHNFAAIANKLRGATDEVTVSTGLPGVGAIDGDTRAGIKEMAEIARDCGMRMTLCSQPDNLVPASSPARCIDARRLSDLAHRPIDAMTHPKWSGCLCAAAYDIGTPMAVDCVLASSAARRDDHNPDGEFLVPPPALFEMRDGTDLPF